MLCVFEDELTPAVRSVLCVDSVIEQRVAQRIKAIVVPRSSIDDVPRVLWVVQAVGIGLIPVRRVEALIHVRVTAVVEIDTIVVAIGIRRQEMFTEFA